MRGVKIKPMQEFNQIVLNQTQSKTWKKFETRYGLMDQNFGYKTKEPHKTTAI